MQVNAPTTAQPSLQQTAGVTGVRVLAGNLSAVPVGTLLQATVTQVSQGQAVIVVNGQTLTVRPSGSLQPGNILLVRSPGGSASPTLDVVTTPTSVPNPSAGNSQASPANLSQNSGSQSPGTGSATAAATTGGNTATTATVAAQVNSSAIGTQVATQAVATNQALQLARVEVLAVLPDGRVRIQIDGQEESALSTAELTAGEQYVVQVERTPTGLTLSNAPDSPELPAAFAAAILRDSSPPDLAAALKPLLEELANLQTNQPANTPGSNSPSALQSAGATVREVLQSFLPSTSRALNATELQNLVQDGGLHFEAKLARMIGDDSQDSPNSDASGNANQQGAIRPGSGTGGDLKEALLRLLQTAQELGEMQLPAAKNTLTGIEAQQAANVFAQTQDTPYILQIPFPDGGKWQTLHLAIDPENRKGKESGSGGGFRMLMHVPLTELGETWIDAGLSGNNLRAVFYLSSQGMREQVRAELPALREELLADGFSEVLLDVRAPSDLPRQQQTQAAAMRLGRPQSGSILNVSV